MTVFKVLVFILFLLLSIGVKSQPAVIVGSASAEPGDTVSIPIDYIGTGSVVGFQVDIFFDNANLLVSMNCGSLGGNGVSCSDHGNFIRILVFDSSLSELPSGNLGMLDFTVSLSSLVSTSYPLTVSNQEYSDNAGNTINPQGTQNGAIFVDQLFSIGGALSGLGASSVTLQNNAGDDLTLSVNGSFVFPTKLVDLANYSVTVSNQPTSPDQTCTVTGGTNGDGTGVIAAADVVDIQLICNDSPIIVPDSYSMLEDTMLIANDVSGNVNDTNDDSVLFNDSDSDTLSIVNPGTFDPIDGIGGSLTLNSDGTFTYSPPDNDFGTATFSFEVTDGFSNVPSSLTIEIAPVNDQPTFDIQGNIVSFPFITPPNSVIQFPGFANNVNVGSLEELTQSVAQFNLTIISDNNSILIPLSTTVTNDGTLNLDLTFNEGVAVLQLELVDDGGVINGGVDTSIIHEFSVSFFDSVYENGFEEVVIIKSPQQIPSLFVQANSIYYNNHLLDLFDSNDDDLSMRFINGWVSEITTLENSK